MAEAGPSRINALDRSGNDGTAQTPSEPPGGGLAASIRLRTKAPLPLFSCPHPIPPSSATIGETLKLSVLRLLTGEVTESSSTAPMTASEQLKLLTIHGWRMQMIALELRQNVLIAPETRNRIGEGVDDEMPGFELSDDSECGLLESDDEVLIRLKAAYTLDDLHLPSLAVNHHYALPPGALTRAGTLSSPPPYSKINVRRAAEPSSHSSSVQGQPEADYHARQYRDYSRGFRVVTVQSATPAPPVQQTTTDAKESRKGRASGNAALSGPSKALGLGMGVEPPAAVPTATVYKAPVIKSRKSNPNVLQNVQASHTAVPPAIASPTDRSAPPSSPTSVSARKEAVGDGSMPPNTRKPSGSRPSTSRTNSATPMSPEDRRVSAPPATFSGSNAFNGSGPSKSVVQDSMPLTALVIGPGVQGAVGRSSNPIMGHSGAGHHESAGNKEADGSNGSYGNRKAFTSFTAAGGEVGHRAKPRRSSSHSSAQADVERRKLHAGVRTKSSEILSSSNDRAKVTSSKASPAVTADTKPSSASRAAVEAAQRRLAASRLDPTPFVASPQLDEIAEGDGAGAPRMPVMKERRSSSGKYKREKVVLPDPPVLPPIANLAPFPETIPIERGLPAMPTPADSPATPVSPSSSPKLSQNYLPEGQPQIRPSDDHRKLQRKQSSAAQSGDSAGKMLDQAARNGNGHTLDSAEDVSQARLPTNVGHSEAMVRDEGSRDSRDGHQSSSGQKPAVKEGRFARWAEPGLGLGGRPPMLQSRKSSSKSASSGANKASRNTNVAPGQDDSMEEAAGNVAVTTESEREASSKQMSRADRRYQEYQKQRSTEVARQLQAEQERLKQAEKAKMTAEKESRRQQEEQREKSQREKWEIWEEVRKRADMEKNREREQEKEVIGR
ncbi:unnamed protein product [Parajaminaea phylloscopi]